MMTAQMMTNCDDDNDDDDDDDDDDNWVHLLNLKKMFKASEISGFYEVFMAEFIVLLKRT